MTFFLNVDLLAAPGDQEHYVSGELAPDMSSLNVKMPQNKFVIDIYVIAFYIM